jgi:type I restriction enzyme M protein
MLDTSTKRRIDTARDILVGKVPDPKSQVEQITIALIYKFMDDMDAEAEELGGHRKFFAGDYARYGWAKLMHSGMGGHETLNLYQEAIAKMPENPGIPALFREIFKNAYLPYRDPETLRAFLKIIDEFTYDHSERLGDAFEYLLSVLGSQGDAGQFRTPRHIIDFMVAVLDPKKNETVLDPACGTAGFLISSYKHILKHNVDKHGNSTLTPDDRERLAKNFLGYDISPDMVRLSLVNLYLHGFTDPHIHEYDTLTSQDRWNEHADVILANPPFMSPKGGIKPHNRFSVQSKRSEVLFVDYMAEHLTPNGRAGIIVPEGIIFQSQTAYKQLRKMLVDEFLVAVVSLPAGVFQPYSGVKTSILLLDKSLARRADSIAFIKVENDGFGLGAQRREIEKNDLPAAATFLKSWLPSIQSQASIESIPIALLVPKEKIAEDGDYYLNGERYREGAALSASFPLVPLGEVCQVIKGSPITRDQVIDGTVPVIAGGQQPSCYHNTANRSGETITVSASGAYAGFVAYFDQPIFASDCSTIQPCNQQILSKFLFRLLKSKQDDIYAMQVGMGQPHIYPKDLVNIQIPLPPLEVQKEIVAEIEGYQKVIDGARAVLDNYRPHIPINPEWPMVELREVIESKPKNGYSGTPVDYVTNLRVLSLSATTSGKLDITKFKFIDEAIAAEAPCRCRRGDIYLQRGNTRELVGTAAIFDIDDDNYIYPDLMIRVRANEAKVCSQFLLTALQSIQVRTFVTMNAVGAAGSMPKINQGIVERIPIPLPPVETQQAIVAEIEAEQALVNANRELIARMERKIQATLARLWGESKEGADV